MGAGSTGAALVPDADHHNATIAHSLPPLSNAVCAGVGALAGGHRRGTHSLIGLAAFVAVAWIAGFFADLAWRPPIPGLPRLRAFQRQQLGVMLAWASRRLHLSEPDWVSELTSD